MFLRPVSSRHRLVWPAASPGLAARSGVFLLGKWTSPILMGYYIKYVGILYMKYIYMKYILYMTYSHQMAY